MSASLPSLDTIGTSLSSIRDYATGFDKANDETKKLGDDFASALFEKLAGDDGKISKEELNSKISSASTETKEAIWNKLDKNDDGFITADEMEGEDLFYDFSSTDEMDLVEVLYSESKPGGPIAYAMEELASLDFNFDD